ncbi:MAG: DUF6090 family protein [Cyclobacteriaceae bacterium]
MKRILNKLAEKWPEYIIEAMVIIASILGAFALDSWNENRKEKVLEAKFLSNLKLDLQTDTTNLNLMIVDRKQKAESALTLLEMETAPANRAEMDQYVSLIWNLFSWTTFTPRTNTVDELIGSGNLSILSDDSVKMHILNIKQMNEELIPLREHMRREYEHYLYDRANITQPITIGYDLRSVINGDYDKLEMSSGEIKRISKQVENFLNDLSARNGLTLAALNNIGIAERYAEMILQREKLLARIDLNLTMQNPEQ